MIFGYCRVSTPTQNIDRQIRNIKAEYQDAIIFKEVYTGTKLEGRIEFQKILKVARAGDTIVFDSVSRMSRNAEEGKASYFNLYEKGIKLVFLKEHHIDTDSYARALAGAGIVINSDGSAEGNLVSEIAEAITKFMRLKAGADIDKAFEQSEKEVQDLRQRTREGLVTARANGKQIGNVKGCTFETKKSKEMKEKIRKIARDFDGNLTDTEAIALLNLSRNTYYKYKKQIMESA